jgi:hypothetical protein
MRKLNVPCRDRSLREHLAKIKSCELTSEVRQIIDGELLGDACIRPQGKYAAHFDYGSKYRDYLVFLSSLFKTFGIEQIGEIYEKYYEELKCFAYHYFSCNYVELLQIYQRWYPNGIKIVPCDIDLTPLVCRQWYIGDGNLSFAPSKNGRRYIRLSTDGFSVLDVEFLVYKLTTIGFLAKRQPARNIICISTDSTDKFLDYIGPCPIDCYKYKWRLSRVS